MRAYLAIVIGVAAAIVAMAAAVSVTVDPFAIHGSVTVAGFNELKPALAKRARLWKTVTVARGDWEALVVGTSRAEIGVDPANPFFAGRRCFNAALGNQSYEESVSLVEAALAQGELRQVLAMLDFPVSNAHVPYPADFTAENYRRTRPFVVAASWDSLLESMRTPFAQDRAVVRQKIGLWQRDGRFISPLPTDHHAHAIDSERSYLSYHYFPAPLFTHAFASGGREPLAHIRRLVAVAHAHGLDLTLAIGPAHARQWETLVAAGLWDTWEEWKRRLVAINEEEARRAGRPPFPLWDFSGYSEMSTEPFPALGDTAARMKWYWDSSHFNREAGDIVLDRMAGRSPAHGDLGVLLASGMLETHLAVIRSQRDAWRRRFPEEVREIEALAEEGRARFSGVSSSRP